MTMHQKNCRCHHHPADHRHLDLHPPHRHPHPHLLQRPHPRQLPHPSLCSHDIQLVTYCCFTCMPQHVHTGCQQSTSAKTVQASGVR